MCQITSAAAGWKMKFGRSAQNSQGTCPMVGTAFLWRWQVPTTIPQEAVQVWVSKCAKSRQELPAEKWRLANLLKTHGGPAPSWGQHPLKTAGPYLKPPWSSTAQSKCAKSCQEPPAEKWSLADLLETHSRPGPDQGPPSLKMVSP